MNNNNAAKRDSFVGNIYNLGVQKCKQDILETINMDYSHYHNEGRIHIHDLEAYGETYNCLSPDVVAGFPFDEYIQASVVDKYIAIFEYYKYVIVNLGNMQTGGIGFANFDLEVSRIIAGLEIHDNDYELLGSLLWAFIKWINVTRTRYGEECYYVTLNLGLATDDVGRFITKSVLEKFSDRTVDYIRPNIVFKVKQGINFNKKDINYDLYQQALNCTSKKMIPTYLLCDSKPNVGYEPVNLSIMGCRTRVVDNIFGDSTSIGRGNFSYITINCVRIALELNEKSDITTEEKVKLYKMEWQQCADLVSELLMSRLQKFADLEREFPLLENHKLWVNKWNKNNMYENIKNSTLSIGFIGLSETVEILCGNKYYEDSQAESLARDLIAFMKQTVDDYKETYQLNFSLLATSGEYISGRFPALDSKIYKHEIIDKGYYTNSFHVNVDSGINPLKKIEYEGHFHEYCNGGCITYVELPSVPLGNIAALNEIVGKGISSGINYLGINFPLDICNDCGEKGTFDTCGNCKSGSITRFRRVSGYLEDYNYFAEGKKKEVLHRIPNVIDE